MWCAFITSTTQSFGPGFFFLFFPSCLGGGLFDADNLITGLDSVGTCGTPRLKRKRRRRAEDEQQYLEYCRVGSTIDTECRRRERDQVNWGLYGEANEARTRAGHRAIDGTVLRRNASEVKSSTSAPLLSTTHSHAGNGRKSIVAPIVDCRGRPRSGKGNPLSNLLVQEENMGIRSASRVRIFAQANR
ncbi:hypothetical protein FJTKL_10415 [Diaporthe vaccinii]|uniref:Secreted protein n=1 Tax=Diaporthe vaccinii TaxID=105482 RepID=A0ABR4EKE0_9PEZI